MMTVIDFSTARRKLTCPRDERVHGATSTTYAKGEEHSRGGALIPTGSVRKLLRTPLRCSHNVPTIVPTFNNVVGSRSKKFKDLRVRLPV